MDQPRGLCQTPDVSSPDRAPEPLSVVCVGADVRGHRHIVHSGHDGIVAFLCGRWRPEAHLVRVEKCRRHMHICHTCRKTWERVRKERVS
jgi:hypothetical protein